MYVSLQTDDDYYRSHVYRDFVLDESKIVVDIEDVFSAVNGSVHLFTLIVLERNDFMPDDVREGTLEMPLLTWAKVSETFSYRNFNFATYRMAYSLNLKYDYFKDQNYVINTEIHEFEHFGPGR